MLLTNATRSLLLHQGRHTLLKAVTVRSLSSLTSHYAARTGVAKAAATNTTASPQVISHNSTSSFSSAASSPPPLVDTSGRDAYNVSETFKGTDACHKVGLDKLGITGPTTIYRNLTYQEMWDHETANQEGTAVHAKYGDVRCIMTGKYTGRSPKDKFIVKNEGSETAKYIDWGPINQPTTPQVFDELYDRAVDYFNTRDTVYVFDGYCGANPASRKKVRFVFEMAWQVHFGE